MSSSYEELPLTNTQHKRCSMRAGTSGTGFQPKPKPDTPVHNARPGSERAHAAHNFGDLGCNTSPARPLKNGATQSRHPDHTRGNHKSNLRSYSVIITLAARLGGSKSRIQARRECHFV